jgi:hypothetical protein
MSDYYGLGPCKDEPGKISPFPDGIPPTAFIQDILNSQTTAISTVVAEYVRQVDYILQFQDKQITNVVNTFLTQVDKRIQDQDTRLNEVIQGYSSLITSQITEQQVQLNLITSLLELEESQLIQLFKSPPGQLQPTPISVTVNEPPIVIPPTTVTVNVPENPPASPPVTQPSQPVVPPPPQIIYVPLPCPTESGGPGSYVNNNDNSNVFDPVSKFSPSITIYPRDSSSSSQVNINRGVPPGSTSTSPREGPKGSDLPPVDLDQPLAFKFSRDDNYWKLNAVNFYGTPLADMLSAGSMDEFSVEVAGILENVSPNPWPELING